MPFGRSAAVIATLASLVACGWASNAPAAAARAPRCAVGDLRAKAAPGNPGLGHAGFVLVVRNRSHHACAVFGYPGLQRLTASGGRVLTRVRRGSGYLFRDRGPRRLVLRPGGAASSGVGWVHIPRHGTRCRGSSRLEVTPPDERRHLVVRAFVDACGGRVSVTALRAGARG